MPGKILVYIGVLAVGSVTGSSQAVFGQSAASTAREISGWDGAERQGF